MALVDDKEITKTILNLINEETAKGTSKDDLAKLICEKIILPLEKEIEEHFANIAWAYGNYTDRSSN